MPESQISEALLRQFYAYDHDLPLSPHTKVLHDSGSLRVERFEINSRQEQRVPGLLLTDPNADGPRPVVLLAHPATLDKSSDYILAPAREWVARGTACVTIDQAAHGERATRPVSIEDFQRYPLRQADQTVQTTVDWMRVLDYLEQRPEVDMARVAFVGFSMGGRRGAPFVGLDKRVTAAVFCISGAARGTPDGEQAQRAQTITDPASFAPLMDGRAKLVVAGTVDDIMPPDSVQRFYDAMPEPKQIEWLECGHWDFMPQGLAPVWPFLDQQLL